MEDNTNELQLADGLTTVTLTELEAEIGHRLGGWEGLFEVYDIRPVTDFIGRRAITAAAARRLLPRSSVARSWPPGMQPGGRPS